MVELLSADFGRLVFDRDAIVRAALRAYVESSLFGIARFWDPAYDWADWAGDLKRGALLHIQDCDHVVVAWTEAGVVGLAYELGRGPIEQLDVSADAVTGGPEDVRRAVAGLPDELEPALVLATSMIGASGEHGERDAGVGFWLCGDRGGGMLFHLHLLLSVYRARGAERLAPWGLLYNGRLLPRSCEGIGYVRPGKVVVNYARPQEAPVHAIMDAVVDRRLKDPTEFTPAELDTLLHPALGPEQMLGAQRCLQRVGITWPGSPELPAAAPEPRINPFTDHPFPRPEHAYVIRCFGPVAFNQPTILRAALRAYIESILAPLDPLARHTLIPCIVPKWKGDLQQGAFYNGNGCGEYDIIAWTEAGLIGLAYKRGAAPIEPLSAALPGLPDDLLPALDMAQSLLDTGVHGEKLASIGFWLHGDRTGGTLFDDPTLPGGRRLAAWGALDRSVPWGTQDKTGQGRLPLLGDRDIAALAIMLARTTASPIHALLDAVVDRRLHGPTELSADELTTLFPTPINPEERLFAQTMLQKAGITWPGALEISNTPEAPEPRIRSAFLASSTAVARCHPLGFLVFDKEAMLRAALRAYIEATLGYLDPLERHKFKAVSYSSRWTGDLVRGGLSIQAQLAWTEAGIVGLTHDHWSPPHVWLPEDTAPRIPDDVRMAVPDLPDELVPAFEMAFELFNQEHPRRLKVEPVGFWLCGDRLGGTLFETPTARGVWDLGIWGRVGRGRLLPHYKQEFATTITPDTFKQVAPLLAVIDALTARALCGPTELTTEELAIVLPTPPRRPDAIAEAQERLRKVGITLPAAALSLPSPLHTSGAETR